MKNTIATKDYNYSLHNIENYNKELNTNINEILKKYLNLLVEYYKFIIENIKIKNKQFTRFIITRGLDTITNVFLNLLLYTKNADLTYFHCQKSFYFYVEFVGQISEDDKMFLQLTSRDASTYVYKKTIFEINNELKKMNDDMNIMTREKFEIINFHTTLCKKYLLKVIEKTDFSKNDVLFNIIEETLNKLNSTQIKIEKLKLFELVSDKLLISIENAETFFKANQHLVKKFVKNNNILNNCEKKFLSEDFENKINNEPYDKIISWLLN
jgi:hypothetical protein